MGFRTQYAVGAGLIYDRLLDGDLESIRLADPNAGSADDIQIVTANSVDAYQVKWTDKPGLYSFNQLIADKDGRAQTSLVAGLALGWRDISARYPGRTVRVHLITNEYPSVHAFVPIGDDGVKRSFNEFVRAFDLGRQGFPKQTASFDNAVEALRQKSGIGTDFDGFFESFTCHFGYQDPINGSTSQLGRRITDLRQLADFLFTSVANPVRKIEFSRAELLEQLGWTERFRLRFRHEFPVSEMLYRPIAGTVQALEDLVGRLDRGYLALLGSPGAGKSTTLTHTFRYKPGLRVIKYYAYVRNDPLQGRGEAGQFWHDLFLMLRTAGIDQLERTKAFPATPEEFKEAFFEQLAELGRQWKERSIKTLLLIDGLDHIQREQNPVRSLIEELPTLDALPPGVLIICGSQTLDLEGLSPRIRAQLEAEGRTIQMQRLSREAVYSIVDAAGVGKIDGESSHERLHELSAGHPLALSYLIEKLTACGTDSERNDVLANADTFSGDIETDYRTFWLAIRSFQTKEICALVCRLRDGVDLRLLRSVFTDQALEEFRRDAHHYFEKPGPNYWRFFHNSFKQFLLQTTRNDLVTQDAGEREIELQKKLAVLCDRADKGSPIRWERLYHLFQANEFAAVISLGSQSFFREQFFASRSFGLIREDLDLVLQAAGKTQDGLAIVRTWLLEHELGERGGAMAEHNLANLIMLLDGADAALSHAVKHDALRIGTSDALELCLKMASVGAINAASALFEKCEPLDLITGADASSAHDGNAEGILEKWCDVAHYFRPLDKLFGAIESIRVEPAHFERQEDAEQRLHENLVWQTGLALIERDDRTLYEKFIDEIEQRKAYIHLRPLLARQCATSLSSVLPVDRELDVFVASLPADDNESAARLVAAEALLRMRGESDFADSVAQRGQPPLAEVSHEFNQLNSLHTFAIRIKLNRLLSSLGRPVDPVVAVPSGNETRRAAGVLFERMLVLVANVWGSAIRGEFMEGQVLLHALQPALRLFHRAWTHDELTTWSQYRALREEYFRFMVSAVAAHGAQRVSTLAAAIEEYWHDSATQNYWSQSLMRTLSLEFWRRGDAQENLARRLKFIATLHSADEGPTEQFDSYFEQSKAWALAGNTDAARIELASAFSHTFGIYHDEDSQLLDWTRWLLRLSKSNPALAASKVEFFLPAISSLVNGHRGSSIQQAATTLIRTGYQSSPDLGARIRKTLLHAQVLEHCAGVEGLALGLLDADVKNVHLVAPIIAALLVPFNANLASEISQALFTRAEELNAKNFAADLAEFLSEVINTKEFPSHRKAWFRGMAAGLREGGPAKEAAQKRCENSWEAPERTSDKPIVLADGGSLSESEIVARIATFADLKALIGQTQRVTYLPWDRVLADKLEGMTNDELMALPELLGKLGSTRALFATTSKIILARGERELAGRAALEAFGRSEPGGWLHQYDGGARIETARCLLEIDAEKWRPFLLNALVEDYRASYRGARERITGLEDFESFLFQAVPIEALWGEIEQHFLELNEFKHTPRQRLLSSDRPSQAACAIVVDAVVALLGSRVNELAMEAQTCLLDLLVTGNRTEILACIAKHLVYDGNSDGVVYLLCALNLSAGMLDADFSVLVPNLRLLESHADFGVRRQARQLLAMVDANSSPTTIAKTELPPIYNMSLPPLATSQRAVTAAMVTPGEPLPDLGDAFEIVAPFDSEIRALAEQIDVQFEVLLERCMQIMHRLAPVTLWNADAEGKLREQLNSLDIKLAFRRPRTSLVYRAIRHIIGELVDAKKLSARSFHAWLLARIADPLIIRPDVRPPFIPLSIPHQRSECAEWAKHENMNELQFVSHPESQFAIIGEVTVIAGYDWTHARERRKLELCFAEAHHNHSLDTAGVARRRVLEAYRSWYASDYPDRLGPRPDLTAVIRGTPLLAVAGQDEWLAANPVMCRKLDWIPDEHGLFRWRDSTGKLMVESVYWQDGPVDREGPRFDDRCGKGWLVVASAEGYSRVLELGAGCSERSTIARSYREDGVEISNTREFERLVT